MSAMIRRSEVGSRPKDYVPSHGFAYGGRDELFGQTIGVEGGFGLHTLNGEEDGFHVGSDLLSANGFLGTRMEDDGSRTYGAGAHGKVAGITGGYGKAGEGWFADLSADALGADAEASFNAENGFDLSANAYLVQAGLEGGHLDAETGHDFVGSVGVGVGAGLGARGHWGDEDGDGIREIGFGLDLPLLSFDFKSETLGQAYNWASENWDDAADWVGDTWDDASEWTGDAWDTASDFVGDTWDAGTQLAGDAWDATTDFAGDAWDTASGWASDAGDAVGDFFSGW